MKKNLIVALALVFVLGIAGTAFAAANPFTDVPAKHWAYDAVSKLAQAGILDGYGDGTYRGERTATRYEMAQATAKAMARADKADAQMKALIDKLAVEFAAELNNLGVRVAKLEKNASSIKFSGDARVRYQTNTNLSQTTNSTTPVTLTNANTGATYTINDLGSRNQWSERLRIYATANLNEKVTFFGRLAYNLNSLTSGPASNDSEGALHWDIGQFEFNQSPTTKIIIGRMSPYLLDGFIADPNGKIDGFEFRFGDPLKIKIGYADWGQNSALGTGATVASSALPANYFGANRTRTAYWVDLAYAPAKDWSLFASTFQAADTKQYPFSLWGLGVKANLATDWSFLASYVWNTAQEAKDINAAWSNGDANTAWAAQIGYKGAQWSQPGSWGLYVNYRDVKPMSLDGGLASGILGQDIGLGNGYSASTLGTELLGLKGWGFNGNYTVSKNVRATVTYFAYERSNSALLNKAVAPTWSMKFDLMF